MTSICHLVTVIRISGNLGISGDLSMGYPSAPRICPCDESGRSVTVTPVRPVIKVISDTDVSFLKQGVLKIAEDLGKPPETFSPQPMSS